MSVIPDGLDKTASHINLLTDGHQPGGGNRRKEKSEFPFSGGIEVTFDGQGILRRKGAIGPKAAAEHVPAVRPVLSAGEVQKLVLVEILRVHAVVRTLAQVSSVLQRS